MKCPACGSEQSNDVKCEECGIYFEKYNKQQELGITRENVNKRSRRKTKTGNNGLTSIVVVLAVLAGLGYWLLGDNDTEENTASKAKPENPITNSNPQKEPPKNSISARLNQSNPPKNAIEAARNATVFIETSWGSLGSGFLISNQCEVVTNRHVVELSAESALASLMRSPEVLQGAYSEQQSLAQELGRLKMLYQERIASEGPSEETEALRVKINETARGLNSLPEDVERELKERAEDMAFDAKNSEHRVSLFDGTEYKVNSFRFSQDHDLAFFVLDGVDCPFIEFGNPKILAQGDALFTVGNPSGLSYTVTSGVFSGYRDDGDDQYLQTDAPINPGNSGGPLLTDEGKAVGVNTFVLRDAQNIGFAIPISIVASAK